MPVKVLVKDRAAQIITTGSEDLAAGMPLRISGQEYLIASADPDEYGRFMGTAEVTLPGGSRTAAVMAVAAAP